MRRCASAQWRLKQPAGSARLALVLRSLELSVRQAPLRAAPLAMAALGMGAPILTSLAASAMPMTGLDFLTQRAGLTRPGWLPPAYAPAGVPPGAPSHDGVGAAAKASVRTSGLDLLMARAQSVANAPTSTATARSWAARGGTAVLLSSTEGTAASERRRAAGLAVLPEGGEKRDTMAARLQEASTISSRLSYMDFSEETTAHFNEVARSMLSMGTGAPRKATEAL